MFSWRAKRQWGIILSLGAVFLGVIAFFVYRALPTPHCFDNKRNQGEVEIDCGGPCAPCELRHPKPVVVFWARAVPVRENIFDVAAEIQNTNEVLSSGRLTYEFALFDDFGRIAERRGRTFLFAQERLVVIESAIEVPRNPVRIEFKIVDTEWQLRKDPPPNLVVERRDYRVVEEPGITQSLVEAVIRNASAFDFPEAEVHFVLRDREGNLVAANRVLLENVSSGTRQVVKAIWPRVLPPFATIEVNARVNIFAQDAMLKPR